MFSILVGTGFWPVEGRPRPKVLIFGGVYTFVAVSFTKSNAKLDALLVRVCDFTETNPK